MLEGLLTPADAAQEATTNINEAIGFPVNLANGYGCESVGDFTLWHSWEGNAAAALAAAVETFKRDRPNIYVNAQFVAASELISRFSNGSATDRPDLLLVPHQRILPLIENNWVHSIGPLVEPELLQRYRPVALNAFRTNERLYGLPIFLRTVALVYNRNDIETPALPLADLLVQAEMGDRLTLSLDFADLFWGIGAFGGQLIDDANQVGVDQTAFAGWLGWLQQAELLDAVRLSESAAAADERFINGEVSYRVATPALAAQFIQALGEESIGIATLPSGPEGESTPLVSVDGFSVTTQDEAKIAPVIDFMRYVTSAETQRAMLETYPAIPANANVDVTDNRLLAPFVEQLTTAIPYPLRPEMATILELGGDAYVWVQSGVLTPSEAAAEVVELINQANGISAFEPDSIRCAGRGAVQLWLTGLTEPVTDALQSAADQFNAICPEISVGLRAFEDEASLRAALAESDESSATLLLGPGRWLPDLMADAAIVPAATLVDAAALRRLLPSAVASVSADGQAQALPISVETTALYINRNRVTTPATTLDELLNEAQIGRRVALLTEDRPSLWGIGAFASAPPVQAAVEGTTPPSPWPSESALVEWFRWLLRAQNTAGVLLGGDDERALALFTSGRLGYYSGGPALLPILQAELGSDVLDVVPLPAGPGGAATPLLYSRAIYFPAASFASGSEGDGQQAALSFALYLTGVEAQTLLVERAQQVPANRLVDTARFPDIARFVAQAATAIPYPSPQGIAFLETVTRVTADLVEGRLTPEEAAAQVSAATGGQ